MNPIYDACKLCCFEDDRCDHHESTPNDLWILKIEAGKHAK